MYIEKLINKYGDAYAFYFSLGYSEINLWSLTTVDAYRTPTAKIVTKEDLDKFLKDW